MMTSTETLPLLSVIAACCDGHCNLTHLPRVKMEDFDPFSTLMAADVIPHDYPEAEDDELVGDLPLPGEKDVLYAVLTAAH